MSTVAKNGIQSEFYPPTVLSTPVDTVDALQPDLSLLIVALQPDLSLLIVALQPPLSPSIVAHKAHLSPSVVGCRRTVDGLKPS
ncbi:hypothetical protein [Nostoc sp.]